MKIKSEFDIQFHVSIQTPIVALLRIHPSLESRLVSPDTLNVEHIVAAQEREAPILLPVLEYIDGFGNRCSRFVAPVGAIRLSRSNVLEICETPDPQGEGITQMPIEDLPDEVLQFLLPSRYCKVDEIGAIATDLFGDTEPGWKRAATIRDQVHDKVAFNYKSARSTKTAMDVFTERVSVCRDFPIFSIWRSRSLARSTYRHVMSPGYLGDIRAPYAGAGDFSAWYQVWLDGRWWDMDARHHKPRLGRILMAAGRDAVDVAITTSFGAAKLTHFYVESNEVDSDGRPVPLPMSADRAATCPMALQS